MSLSDPKTDYVNHRLDSAGSDDFEAARAIVPLGRIAPATVLGVVPNSPLVAVPSTGH
jgi:hypothetical protein